MPFKKKNSKTPNSKPSISDQTTDCSSPYAVSSSRPPVNCSPLSMKLQHYFHLSSPVQHSSPYAVSSSRPPVNCSPLSMKLQHYFHLSSSVQHSSAKLPTTPFPTPEAAKFVIDLLFFASLRGSAAKIKKEAAAQIASPSASVSDLQNNCNMCYMVAYLEDRKYSRVAPFGGFAFIGAWASLLL